MLPLRGAGAVIGGRLLNALGNSPGDSVSAPPACWVILRVGSKPPLITPGIGTGENISVPENVMVKVCVITLKGAPAATVTVAPGPSIASTMAVKSAPNVAALTPEPIGGVRFPGLPNHSWN